MPRFMVTFGVQYGPGKVQHPILPEADGDGYVILDDQPDEEAARQLAVRLFCSAWAFVYPEDGFNDMLYPLGCVARFNRAGERFFSNDYERVAAAFGIPVAVLDLIASSPVITPVFATEWEHFMANMVRPRLRARERDRTVSASAYAQT